MTKTSNAKMRNYTNSSKNNRRKSFLSIKKKKDECTTDQSGDISHNNRELATALSKARSQIRELEDEKLRFCGERQELMERVSTLNSEIERCRSNIDDDDDGEITPNSKVKVQGISQSLHSQLEKATEILLECSSYLASALQSVNHIQDVCSCENNGNNLSQYFMRPTADVLSPNSDENAAVDDRALSLTTMTPSNSSASSEDSLSSDNGVMLSPDHHVDSNHQQETMEIDIPRMTSTPDNINVVCSSPNNFLTKSFNSVVYKLAVTPEEYISQPTFSNSKKSTKRLQSPVSTIDKRCSKRRNVRQNFCYKEPSLTRKLRQGDPFTDKSLFSPGHVRLGKQRQYAKRKNKEVFHKDIKRMKH